MRYTTLYQRPRQALDPSDIGVLPPARVPSVRHLLDQPEDSQAICGYQVARLDLVEHYVDPFGRDCAHCVRAAAQRETEVQTTGG